MIGLVYEEVTNLGEAMAMQDRWYQLDTDNSGARALLSTSAGHVLARAERFSVVTLHCMGWAGGLDRSEVQQLLKGMERPAEERDMDAAMAELDPEFSNAHKNDEVGNDEDATLAQLRAQLEPWQRPLSQPLTW